MSIDPMQKVIFRQAEHIRKTSHSDRTGWIYEVKKDAVRVCMGYKPDGSEWLSPWLDTTNMRGGARERRDFIKGQSVRLSAAGADFRLATVSHWAPSKPFPAPDHADDIKGESYQMGKLRVSKVKPDDQQSGGQGGGGGGASGQSDSGSKHSYNIWIAEEDGQSEQHQGQQSTPFDGVGSGSSSGSAAGGGQQQQKKSGTPAMVMRVSEDGGITARVGKDEEAFRFSASKDGAKISYGSGEKAMSIFVTKEGCYSTKPIRIKKDSIKNDDKHQ